MDFGERLKKLRLEKSLGQKELAEMLDVGRNTVSMWESGLRYPSRERMEKLSDIFNCDVDYLYCKSNVRQKARIDKDGNMLFAISEPEAILVEKYRNADEDTQRMVNRLLAYANEFKSGGLS